MQLIDFEYDGQRLSDYGLTVALFDESLEDARTVSSDISISHIKPIGSDRNFDAGYQYDEYQPFEFSVIKLDCKYVDMKITDMELNHIFKWLNRKHNYIMKPIYDDDSFANVYYKGTFNIKPIKYGYDVIGLSLSFKPDSPYGYIMPVKESFEFTSVNDKFVIYDSSDEYGHIYCNATITVLENGALRLENELDSSNAVIVKDCKKGEVLNFHGRIKFIESSLPSHTKLCNDFNYNFPRIKNTLKSNKNVFKCSLKAKVSLEYSPVRKVGLIL